MGECDTLGVQVSETQSLPPPIDYLSESYMIHIKQCMIHLSPLTLTHFTPTDKKTTTKKHLYLWFYGKDVMSPHNNGRVSILGVVLIFNDLRDGLFFVFAVSPTAILIQPLVLYFFPFWGSFWVAAALPLIPLFFYTLMLQLSLGNPVMERVSDVGHHGIRTILHTHTQCMITFLSLVEELMLAVYSKMKSILICLVKPQCIIYHQIYLLGLMFKPHVWSKCSFRLL